MSFSIDREGTKRALRPPSSNHGFCSPRERSGLRAGQPHHHGVAVRFVWIARRAGTVRTVVTIRRRRRIGNNDHTLAVPGERHRVDAELFNDRLFQGLEVFIVDLRFCRDGDCPCSALKDLVEQPVNSIGQYGDLLFFQHYAGELTGVAGLQVEGSVAGLTNRADDKTFRRIKPEDVHAHRSTLARAKMS